VPRSSTFLAMTAEDLIRIMMHMGTKSKWKKVIKGEAEWAGMDPEVLGPKIVAWIDRTASKEDWGFVQAGSIYSRSSRAWPTQWSGSSAPCPRRMNRPYRL
jgi:hypothetical protein